MSCILRFTVKGLYYTPPPMVCVITFHGSSIIKLVYESTLQVGAALI